MSDEKYYIIYTEYDDLCVDAFNAREDLEIEIEKINKIIDKADIRYRRSMAMSYIIIKGVRLDTFDESFRLYNDNELFHILIDKD